MRSPRPLQAAAIANIRDAIDAGHRRIMLAAPCSFGKTLTAAHLIQGFPTFVGRSADICRSCNPSRFRIGAIMARAPAQPTPARSSSVIARLPSWPQVASRQQEGDQASNWGTSCGGAGELRRFPL
jgi:Type III restriction enzyme, res subunit